MSRRRRDRRLQTMVCLPSCRLMPARWWMSLRMRSKPPRQQREFGLGGTRVWRARSAAFPGNFLGRLGKAWENREWADA